MAAPLPAPRRPILPRPPAQAHAAPPSLHVSTSATPCGPFNISSLGVSVTSAKPPALGSFLRRKFPAWRANSPVSSCAVSGLESQLPRNLRPFYLLFLCMHWSFRGILYKCQCEAKSQPGDPHAILATKAWMLQRTAEFVAQCCVVCALGCM